MTGVGGKGRELYLNNNKIRGEKKKSKRPWIFPPTPSGRASSFLGCVMGGIDLTLDPFL